MNFRSAVRGFGVSALLAGLLMIATADTAFAQRNRGGGGGRGGRSFSHPRGYYGGRSYSSPRGFYGGQRGYYGGRNFLPGNRGYYSNRYYPRGGYGRSYIYFGAPFGAFYYRSYPLPYCNPNGYYDRWGRWYPDPRCAYDPYYGY